jgi:hypothetical protein
MKRTAAILLLLSTFSFNSCKKYIEQKQQDALVDAITNGTWIVTRYLDNGTDITSTFSGYVFKFNQNGTVVGTFSASSTQGTWSGDFNTRTIISDFPSAGDPLQKLNHTWKITDSYPDSVAANTTINSNTNVLNLHKQ